jgi:hypothetical protein
MPAIKRLVSRYAVLLLPHRIRRSLAPELHHHFVERDAIGTLDLILRSCFARMSLIAENEPLDAHRSGGSVPRLKIST